MARKTGLGRGLGSLISAGVTPAKPASPKKKRHRKDPASAGKKKRPAAPKPAATEAAPPPIPEGTRPFPQAARPEPAERARPEPADGLRETAPGMYEIPVARVTPNPRQPRREFHEDTLRELADSIRAEGLLQPVVVRRKQDRFELIAGERRWRACQLLKLKFIPARVMEASEASSAILSLVENLQREDLNPMEEANGYASLLKEFGLTQEQVAERVGRSRAAVANSLRLLQLEREIQSFLVKGILSTGHAKVLLGIENGETRLLLARQSIERGWSVRELERQVERAAHAGERPGRPRTTPAIEQAAIDDLQKQLSSAFSTRVLLRHTARKGRIIIEYYGNDDLQRIMEKMGLP